MNNTENITSKKKKYSLYVLILASAFFNAGCLREVNKNLTDQEARDSYYRGDFGRSFRLTEALAYQGDAKAEYTLGYMYYYGIGAPANKALGKAWIRRSAEQGYPPAITAATQIDVCDSSVTPKRVKKCIDSSREIAPFDDRPNQSQSQLPDTTHKVALTPKIDAEIIPLETVTQVSQTIAVTKSPEIIQEVIKEGEKTAAPVIVPSTRAVVSEIEVPNALKDAVLLTDEMNLALQSLQKHWVVQIATFKNPKNADALVNKLKAAGLPAYARASQSNNKQFTIVMVGPHEQKADAKLMCASLSEQFKLKGMILRDRSSPIEFINEQVMVSYLSFVDTPSMIRFY
jgi:cell division septation protein DedD